MYGLKYTGEKDIAGCGLAGIINIKRERISGSFIKRSIALQHERGNGLGGGFAAYGIYPEYKDYYALHLMYQSDEAKRVTEEFIHHNFAVVKHELIPTRPSPVISNAPLFWRYFVLPKEEIRAQIANITQDDFVVRMVMRINEDITDAYVVSSGKNMGVFKGVGYPEDIADYFILEDYEAYIWTAHNRFPTNSISWWGGAHPFAILDWAIVHNGEISSYGINKRYIEMFGYKLALLTDTEVVTYIFDLLIRKQKLPMHLAVAAIAAPFWKNIDRMPDDERELFSAIRMVYGSALLNGPFALLLSHKEGLIGISDRIKLRPLVAGRKGDFVYMASEEAAIREIADDLDRIWHPTPGHPLIVELDKGVVCE